MKGFKSLWSAMITCHVFEEFRQFFRTVMPLSKKTWVYCVTISRNAINDLETKLEIRMVRQLSAREYSLLTEPWKSI